MMENRKIASSLTPDLMKQAKDWSAESLDIPETFHISA